MCDVHLCDDAIQRLCELGPLGLVVASPAVAQHLLECDECVDRLADMIMLTLLPLKSEKVM